MKDHLELLINELKASQLIIKILQVETKLTSIGPRNQDNLTNCALYKSHDESHPTIDKHGAWKEIRRSRATAMRHKRYSHTGQRVTDTFSLSSNRYNPLCNDSEGDDTPASKEKSRAVESKYVRKHKKDCKKRVVGENNKVIILGDSHARGCAAEVSHLLNNGFEVLGFVNPESGMKYIKGTSRVKLQQLTKTDVVVLLGGGGSNDTARNNSTVGMKHLLEFVTNVNHTNVILMSAPHRYDFMNNSCVNNEVEKFNRKLHKRLERLGKVEMTDVVSARNLYTKHGQHLNSRG